MRLSRASGLHPRCFSLPELHKVGQQVMGGGFGDLWQGLVCGQSVSVKMMRVFKNAHIDAILKEFSREALIWRQLCHPNVLPFFGVYYLENRLCLVSPWMENGNMMEFLTKENPCKTARLSLILDVALGLQYLHAQNVVHGDLKAINILVTPSRTACIADFGLSSIADIMTLRFTHSTSYVQGGTARYQAPELLRGEKRHYGSDVYAFACVCYEILTGMVPFHELPNDMAVILQVIQGKRPSQPVTCCNTATLESLWKLLIDCWEENTGSRPPAPQIVERLAGSSIGATPTLSAAKDWDETFTSKFRRSLQVQPLLPSVNQIEHILFGSESKVHVQDGSERNRYSLTRSTLQVAYVLHFTAFHGWISGKHMRRMYLASDG
ncbi:kinase-like domain-containing protein [Mycena olivaceomarginata]|nr:kinase-like domain-containing protein [Mycena olivaceomarginata]